MARLPVTNIPVSIINVNNVEGVDCNNNTRYYTDNRAGVHYTHNGMTTVLTAQYPVSSCNTYHLKLVITDAVDELYDSGVFLEAGSLRSEAITLEALTPVDRRGRPYLAEGCTAGSIRIRKSNPATSPMVVNLVCSGSANVPGDVTGIPLTVTIPAGQTQALVNISAVTDLLPEGTEDLIIKAYVNCGQQQPLVSDSIRIEIRDLAPVIISPDSLLVCSDAPVRLSAALGYTQYRWDANPTLSNVTVRDPFARPVAGINRYYCSASNGNCQARDSAILIRKAVKVAAEQKTSCQNRSDGAITITAGAEWERPVQFAFNGNAFGNDSVYTNLDTGFYLLVIRDAAGCTDSLLYPLTQQYPTPAITDIATSAATCSGLPDGVARPSGAGGLPPYQYSINNADFFYDSLLLLRGTYTMYMKDSLGCASRARGFIIPFSTILRVQTLNDSTLCEGSSLLLQTNTGAAEQIRWTPARNLSSDTILSPVFTAVSTTTYMVSVSRGICAGSDSITLTVLPAPKPNAGNDTTLCFGGQAILRGSGGSLYQWQPAALLSNAESEQPLTSPLDTSTWFTLRVTGADGCTSLQTDSVHINVRTRAAVYAGPDTIAAINQPLTLRAQDVNNSGFSRFVWLPATGLNSSSDPSVIARVSSDSILYTVMAFTPEGCTATDSIRIRTYAGPQFYVPSAFTPDNNGRNDMLRIIAAGFSRLNYFNVYNRWGQLLFSTANQAMGWNGMVKGKPADPGVYVWVADGTTYSGRRVTAKGTVVLIR
jgi:gliding motility-associated-like protein